MKIAIVGASGHGKVVAEVAELLGYTVSFFDDAWPEKKQLEHWKIHGNTEVLLQQRSEFSHVCIAIGDNHVRNKKALQLSVEKFEFPVLVHPGAIVSHYATVGSGTVVLAGAVVNAFAIVGQGVIVNTGAVVEHDCVLENFVHVSPNAGLAGGTILRKRAWIGINACTRQLTEVGMNSIIGANSTVIKNIPAGTLAMGSPAKVFKEI